MPTHANQAVKITKKPNASTLSKGQKLFNKLSKKIAAQRERLQEWEAFLPVYQQQYTAEYEPLMDQYNHLRTLMLHVFDQAYPNKLLKKPERKQLQFYIESLVVSLLEAEPTDELKAIYNKYNKVDFDTEEEMLQADMQAMLSDVFGVKIDQTIDYRDPEAMLRLLDEQAQAYHAQQEAEELDAVGAEKRAGKGAAKAQTKQQAKWAAEEKEAGQALREVYRKLASSLHPDREPDPVERARKTGLMQRVNVAYDNKDLLGLLALQLEVEQIDVAAINSISEERLKHYNRVLAEQEEELALELVQVQAVFSLRFPGAGAEPSPYADDLEPTLLHLALQHEVAELKEEIEVIELDLAYFSDFENLRKWLRDESVQTEQARAKSGGPVGKPASAKGKKNKRGSGTPPAGAETGFSHHDLFDLPF